MTDIQKLYHIPPWDWPESAADIFLAALRDAETDEADRLLAAELAGNFVVINDDLGGALLDIVANSSETEELRARAVISFGPALEHIDLEEFDELDDFDDFAVTEHMYHRILKTLKRLYFDAVVPTYVRRRILEASVRDPQPWHNDAIRAAFKSGKEGWMLTAVFGMGYVQGFQREILEALQSRSPKIRYQAICAAGNLGIGEAWPFIAGVLTGEHSDKDLLLAAIDASVGIDHTQANTALKKLLDSADDDVVDAVHEALGMLEIDFNGEEDNEDW